MGIFDGYLLLSDFDNTLSQKNTISPENCEAIRYFQKNGGLFALASGRPPKFLERWREYIVPNTWSAMFNGAAFFSPEEEGFAYSCPTDDQIWEIGERIRLTCLNLDCISVHPLPGLVRADAERPLKKEDFDSPVYKIVALTPPELSEINVERVKNILADFPDYRYMRSSLRAIEVQRFETGKGNAVKRYREILGDRIHTIVAAGDFENDLEMIKEADIGYAVGNAYEPLLEAADRVTVSCAEHAIAHIIADLEEDAKNRHL